MEKHKEILKRTCRMCGRICEDIKSVQPKIAFAEALIKIFAIDITQDSDELHGALICKTHVRLLRKHLAAAGRGHVMSLAFTPYVFLNHTDGGQCNVCQPSAPYKPQTVTGKELRLCRKEPSENNIGNEDTNNVDNLLKTIKQLSQSQREEFLAQLPGQLQLQEKEILAKALGQSESNAIYKDSCIIASEQSDSKTYLNYDTDRWLQDRNKVLKEFLVGLSGCDIEMKDKLTLTRTIEQVYFMRNRRVITPLAFFQSFLVLIKTGSRDALAISSGSTPSGSYSFLQKFLCALPLPPDKFPADDIIVVFDNEQVYRGRRGIQTKAVSSVITNVGYVTLDNENLQCKEGLKPKNWFSISSIERLQGCDSNDIDSFKMGINNIVNADSPEYMELEAIHFQTVSAFLQKAIDDVKAQHEKESRDSVDCFLEKQHAKATSIACPSCGAANPRSCRNCKHCKKKGAITLARQQETCVDEGSESSSKERCSVTMTDAAAGKVIKEDHARYSYVPKNEKTKERELVIDEPVLCNPASKSNIICVLRQIGKKSGIPLYAAADADISQFTRKWVTVVVDGLIYLIIKSLKEEVVVCNHPHCQNRNDVSSFISVNDLQNHYKVHHSDVTKMQYSREFDWVLLKVADGHYEHTVLKAYFDLNWLPFLQDCAKKLDFVSDNQLNYVKAGKDHHLTWELFVIVFKSGLQELVLPYVRDCLTNNKTPTAKDFLQNWKAQTNSPCFQFMYQQMCMYGQAIFNLRAGVRHNNQAYVLSAKHILKELLWARNHPKYQTLELYDALVHEFMKPEVKDQIKHNYAFVTKTTGCGEGYDYRLEEANKVIKSLLPSCTPTDQHWYQTCSSAQLLGEIQLKAKENLGLSEREGAIRILRTEAFEQAILKVRALLRQTNFVNQATFLSTEGHSLHPGLLNIGERALLKRLHVIETDILGIDSVDEPSLSHPVYVNLEEEVKYTAIENQTNTTIQDKIVNLLHSIPDEAVAKVFEQQYRTEIQRKKKEKLLRMYHTLVDLVSSYDQSPEDSTQSVSE